MLLNRRIVQLLMHPGRIFLAVIKRLPFGSYKTKCALDFYPRPHYAYGVQQAADLASRLGIERISVVEFGVAGGAGLVELSRQAELAGRETGVQIDVYGFDTGHGLPKPTDHRDLPYIWREGEFSMDADKLQKRLPNAGLVLGNLSETAPQFLHGHQPAPIGFVAIDVDYYSSTASALSIFSGDAKYFLPRVFFYLDDIVGDDDQILHNEYVGELAAIREFNESTDVAKLAPINGLRHKRAIPAPWNDSLYALHRFDHPDYGSYVGRVDRQTQLLLQEPN